MFQNRSSVRTLMAGVLCLGLVPAAWAQGPGQTEFQRGYYLQTHDKNLEGAIGAFEKVVDDQGVPEAMRVEARTRLAQAREDLAAADFARLMPPDVLAYAEISNPGEHFARLAKQMGLVREPGAAAEAKAGATPLADGVFFPHDFALSPALLTALKTVRGAAVAVTGLDARGIPEGLLVVHPGDADLIRGLMESAVQFAQPGEPIEGFKTYSLRGQAWATVTARLFLVARSREALAAAVGRLHDPKAANLASNEDLKSARPERDGALLFAYVDGPKAAQLFRTRVHEREAGMVAGVLDLDHLKAVSAFVRATEDGLQIQARMDLMEGHHNLAYALIRTAPCGRSSLEYIPAGVAGVALIGLNPAKVAGSVSSASEPGQYVTAMDIGREVFANLDEAALFVAPTAASADKQAGPPIPDVGVVLVAKDVQRSEALWSQLLALPALFMPAPAGGVNQVTIEGTAATEYRYPNAPPILLARVKDRAVVIGTAGATANAIRAAAEGKTIAQDAGFKPLLERLTPSTSKAILVHAGRAAETAAGLARGHEAEEFKFFASVLTNLRIALVTDEKPTQFTLRAEATGLPNMPEAFLKFAEVRRAVMQRQMPQVQPAAPQVSVDELPAMEARQ